MKQIGWQLANFLSLVLERPCPLCQRLTSQVFCHDCQRQIEQCQLTNPCQPQAEFPVFAWGGYHGALKRAIGAFKYQGHPHLAESLATGLADAWLMNPPIQATEELTVVPIPMHRNKQKQRGFNQAELLAKHFCRVTRLPLLAQGLCRDRETTAQFSLSASERQENLATAFRPGKPLLNQPFSGSVILLDDIYTTGATIQSATQTLRRCGVRVRGAIVLARAIKEKDKV